jgi:hypothetical protein
MEDISGTSIGEIFGKNNFKYPQKNKFGDTLLSPDLILRTVVKLMSRMI